MQPFPTGEPPDRAPRIDVTSGGPRACPHTRSFVAISIDLCGSTRVKQRIMQLAGGDLAAQQRMFSAYKRLLYDIERSFYVLLMQSPEVEFERLTLIKIIGDELWYSYRLDGAGTAVELRGVRRLLTSLLHLISQDRSLALSEEGGVYRANADVRFNLPIKVYADLVTQCEELNYERFEHLKESVAASRGSGGLIMDIDESYLAVCERLNLTVPPDANGHPAMPARQDFIGIEIDRFFRLTEQCYPRLLTIGQNLFDLIECPLAPAPDFEHLDLKLASLENDDDYIGPACEQVFAVTCPVASRDMKGISDDYSIVHLFDLPCLGDHFAAPSPVVETMMEATRGYLATKGFFALVGGSRTDGI